MEIEFSGQTMSFSKELTFYDKLAIKFSEILRKQNIEHVYVSGYVAILFGRSRTSEDIDILVRRISFDDFNQLWIELEKDFYCHNSKTAESAYNDYLENKLALRFSEKDMVIPNIEFKWISTQQQRRVLDNSLKVILNNKIIPIGPLETQIAYKLYLGSDKDIEDARYLFELFRDKINFTSLEKEIMDLGLKEKMAKTNLGW